MVEHRIESLSKEQYLQSAQQFEARLKFPLSLQASKEQKTAYAREAEELRRRAADLPKGQHFFQDFWTDREQFQARSPRVEIEADFDPDSWKFADNIPNPESLATTFKRYTIYSLNPSWKQPLRLWPGVSGNGPMAGLLYSKKINGQWDYEARPAFWFPPLAVTSREWGNLKWHPIDEFFAEPRDTFRALDEEQVGKTRTAVVERVRRIDTGLKSSKGEQLQQVRIWKAWLDRERGCIPLRIELRVGLALGGRILSDGTLHEAVEVKELQRIDGAGFYPVAGEMRSYIADPKWDGKYLSPAEWIEGKTQSVPMVVGTTTTWSTALLQGNQPMDPETFALRFPEKATILEDGKAINRREPSPAVQPGEEAPTWRLAGWTDGMSRQLSDFRGQVVVLDFWGTWCGSCRNAVPAINRLHEKYRNNGVVVLGIHTAGPTASELQRDVESIKFAFPVAVDAGNFLEASETVARYGVSAFATYIVINRNGKITFNSGIIGDKSAAMNRLKSAALALEIPWPLDAGVTADEANSRFNRILERLLSEEIDKALETPVGPQ